MPPLTPKQKTEPAKEEKGTNKMDETMTPKELAQGLIATVADYEQKRSAYIQKLNAEIAERQEALTLLGEAPTKRTRKRPIGRPKGSKNKTAPTLETGTKENT